MKTFDDFDIRKEVGPLLRRCDRHSLDLYESSVGPDAPTRQQVGVLLAIHQLKEPTQVQISQRSGIDRSTVSGIVRRLVKNGLVRLDPSLNDNRAVTHSLTPKGLAVLNKSMKVLIENQAKLLAPIPVSMRPIFIECLQRLAGFYTAGSDDAPEPVRPAQRRQRKQNSDN